jgi:hypothetical protein
MALLDNEGLIYFSEHYAEEVAKAIRGNETILRIQLPGRKKAKNVRSFYTFIGYDALQSLKEYFERERDYPKPGEPIWLYGQAKRPVNKTGFIQAWLRLLRRARLIPRKIGTKTTRYGFNANNSRDLAISLLNTVNGLNPKCIEFWAGHEIDRLGYNQFYALKPDYVLEQYKIAEPYLNLLSHPSNEAATQEKEEMKEYIKHQDERIKRLEGQYETLMNTQITKG